MVGVRLCCPSPFVSHISALVFFLCIVDAEASDCHRHSVIHKNVGEDVELSCFQAGNVLDVTWKYNDSTVAEYSDNQTFYPELFKNRLYLNPTNFSLTVKNLKINDSGEFSFISFILENQQPQQQQTVFFTLQVVEVLTAPVLTSTSTRNALNASCTVVLECSSEATGRVTYRWTVRNRTTTGTTLTDVIGEEDGDTVFTCTVSNSASEVSASVVLRCSNTTQEDAEGAKDGEEANLTKYLVPVAVVAVVAGIVLCVCCRRRQKATHSHGDQTVYADVSPVAPQNEWQPCSLYDSIDNRDKPVPQSIYDKIQFKYMRETETATGSQHDGRPKTAQT